PAISSIQLSIFHLLRNHNHRSNEVINLTRILMLLDENSSQSRVITIPLGSHDLISSAGLLLSDLYVDINEFEDLAKISSLLDSLNEKQLPGVQEAEEYL